MLRSKIHRATVTDADLHYVGSITIDEDLMDAANLIEISTGDGNVMYFRFENFYHHCCQESVVSVLQRYTTLSFSAN